MPRYATKQNKTKTTLLPLPPKFNSFKIPKLHPDVQVGIHPISPSPSALPSAVPDNLVDITPNYVLNLDPLFVYQALGKVFIMYNSSRLFPLLFSFHVENILHWLDIEFNFLTHNFYQVNSLLIAIYGYVHIYISSKWVFSYLKCRKPKSNLKKSK